MDTRPVVVDFSYYVERADPVLVWHDPERDWCYSLIAPGPRTPIKSGMSREDALADAAQLSLMQASQRSVDMTMEQARDLAQRFLPPEKRDRFLELLRF